MQNLGRLNLGLKLQQGQNTLLPLDHVIGEIREQQCPDNRPEGRTGAVADFINYSHDCTESQPESSGQEGNVVCFQFFARNGETVANKTQSSCFGLTVCTEQAIANVRPVRRF